LIIASPAKQIKFPSVLVASRYSCNILES
jgi:hypothetical protein